MCEPLHWSAGSVPTAPSVAARHHQLPLDLGRPERRRGRGEALSEGGGAKTLGISSFRLRNLAATYCMSVALSKY